MAPSAASTPMLVESAGAESGSSPSGGPTLPATLPAQTFEEARPLADDPPPPPSPMGGGPDGGDVVPVAREIVAVGDE
eukprot:8686451-Pyramimonas_sp.AAC.1